MWLSLPSDVFLQNSPPEWHNSRSEAGFEVALDPLADGKTFYHAASFQIGFSPSTLMAFIFDHLKNHQFDVSN